jgi:IS5 family transposase
MTPKPVRKNASVDVMELARKRFRRRAGIEPVIGHLKSDYHKKKNFLKGFAGDQINLIMEVAAFNFKKWMREVIFWLDKLKPTKTGLKIIFLRPDMMVI